MKYYKQSTVFLALIYFCVGYCYSQAIKYEYGAQGNCGNDCVLRVLHRYGIPATPDGLLSITQDLVESGNKIISYYDMKQLFEGIGFYADAFNASIEELENLPGIKICHLKKDHFIVIEKIEKENITIFNPPLNIEVIPMEQFLEKWDGTILTVEKKDPLDLNQFRFFPFPRMFCDIQKYDWGLMKKDGTIYYDFAIWNLGEETLNIKTTHVTCNCTSYSLDKEVIECGEKAILACRIDTEGKYERDDIGIRVESNDPERLEMNLLITGEVIRTIEALPSKMRLGIIPVNGSKIRKISFRGTGVKNGIIDKIIFSSENMKFVRMMEFKQVINRSGFEFETKWINNPDTFLEKITVYFKEDYFEPMEIIVEGEYQSPIRLDPQVVFIEKGNDALNIKGNIQMLIEKPFQKKYRLKKVKTDIPFLKANFRKNREGYLIGYEGIAPKGEELLSDGKILIIGDNLPENCKIVNIHFIPSGS